MQQSQKIRVVSDLHIEINGRPDLPNLIDDNQTILMLAGDIIPASHFSLAEEWFLEMSRRFSKVIMVVGNHEHYHFLFQDTVNFFKQKFKELRLSNVYVLDNEYIEIEQSNLVIIGGTLWTDFDKGSPFVQQAARQWMNDYRVIDYQDDDGRRRKLRPQDTIVEYGGTTHIIQQTLNRFGTDKKYIIMTHHAPSWQSVSPRFVGDVLNGAFVSDLSDLILKYDDCIKMFIHGHVHDFFEYYIGDTKVICNPQGYGSEVQKFNPNLTFEV